MATFIQGVTDILPKPKLFTPDFSFIDKMLKRKEGMYEEGFAKLNNQYNLISREVTNSANAVARDEFLKSAKANLKNLSTLDLSNATNVVAAGDVFKPFYTNKSILSDQNITQHWNQQTAIGNSFRLKDGGKEFSQDNVDYINQQRMAFAADDPSSVDEYLGGKRYYNPYYNYNQELKDVMKDFKPNHTKIDKLDGMYVKTIDDKSYNALDISRYLNSVLSDKAKQQIKIEAAVKIGNNPSSVAQAYMQSEGAQIPKLNSLIDKLELSLTSEKDPQKIEELTKYKQYYEDQRLEIGNNLKTIRSGDVNFLKKNGEAIAFRAYYNALVEKVSNGYSHTDVEQTIKGNDVAMMYFREDQQWKRQYYSDDRADARQERADVRADRRERMKIEAEKTKDWTDALPVEMAGSDLELYKEGLVKNFEEATNTRTAAYSNLISKIAQDLRKAPDQITEAEFNTWTSNKENQNSVLYKGYKNAHENYEISKQSIDLNKQSEGDYIKSQVGDDNYKLYSSIMNIYNDINKMNQADRNAVAEGRKRAIDIRMPDYEAAKALNISAQEVRNIIQSVNASKNQYREKANEGLTLNVTGFTLGANDPRYKQTQDYLESFTGKKEATGIRYFPDNDPSKFMISFSVDKEEDAKKIISKVVSGGRGREAKYNEETGTLFITGIAPQAAKELDPYYGIPNNHRKALRNIEVFDNGVDSQISTPLIELQDYNNDSHHIAISKKVYNGFDIFTLSVDGKSVNYDFNNAPDAYKAANVILQDVRKIESLK